MNQELNEDQDREMSDECDFSGEVRGKYVGRFAKGSNVVVLDPDVARVFTDSSEFTIYDSLFTSRASDL